VIVNATPAGMEATGIHYPSASRSSRPYFFRDGLHPRRDQDVKMARAKGMHVILGSEMFVQQGARTV